MLLEVGLTLFFSESGGVSFWLCFFLFSFFFFLPNYSPTSASPRHYCNITFTANGALRVSKLLAAFGK